MEETGGDLQDYVNLNRDVSEMDDSEVLDEYYRATKSHLTSDERNFLLEDNFGYDDEVDDPRRLSSFAKICPHKLFPYGSKTVWLDGCYVHTKEWVDK